jgi:hypothetical protein
MATLEERVRNLETTRAVIVTVCIIFGISGAWGYKVLHTAKQELDGLANPVGVFNDAKETALAEFRAQAKQEKDRQVDAFKRDSHKFTVVWDADPQVLWLAGVQGTPVPGQIGLYQDSKELGKHDICILAKTGYQFVANGTSFCEIFLDHDSWKLSATHSHYSEVQGSQAICAALCGTIR